VWPPATWQRPAHVDTTRDALDIGSSYRRPVSIADVSCRRGGLSVQYPTSVTTATLTYESIERQWQPLSSSEEGNTSECTLQTRRVISAPHLSPLFTIIDTRSHTCQFQSGFQSKTLYAKCCQTALCCKVNTRLEVWTHRHAEIHVDNVQWRH